MILILSIHPLSVLITHMSFVASLLSVKGPVSYIEPRINPQWVKAMQQEIDALEPTQT